MSCGFFCRINAAVNDLPWHFKIDAYPTIIFFPAGDKSESVVFPRHLSLSLSNLALFVHRVSSSTFEMRVCRPSCIRHNLDTAVSSVRRLTNRIRRIQRTVAVLRTRLGTQFNFSSFDGTEHDATTAARFPVTATPPPPSPFQQQSLEYRQLVDDVVEPVAMPIDSDMNIAISTGSFVIGDVDEELPSSSSYIPPLSSSSSAVDVTGSSADWPSVCNVTRILKTRDELATMRRRLYRYHEQLALVRYVLRVLLPVSGRTSGHLGRRHWLRLQRRRTRLALRVQNYKDYLSGSDVGSIDFR